jgi:hypothetical protein
MKDLIANLQITNETFLVAWQLVTQRYNNNRLIAMMHAKHLCQMPSAKQDDAASLRQLINHVSSHINAIQALSVNVPIQDLMVNHLMLATLDSNTSTMGDEHSLSCRNTNHCRADHIPGGEVQSPGANPECTVNKYGYYQPTSYHNIHEDSYY